MNENIDFIHVKTDKGAFDLESTAHFIGDDLLIAIYGGDKPHIGAVAVAHSHPSLKDPNKPTVTASLISLPGHKEDEIALSTAKQLAAAYQTAVTVTVGMHWDEIDPLGIRMVNQNSKILASLLIEQLEDRMDAVEAEKILADPGEKAIPWEDAEKILEQNSSMNSQRT